MTVTLDWLLGQRELGLRLLTEVPDPRPLTWAHAIDVVDPAPWLTGGELVLTTGLRLRRAAAEQRAYVERLVGAGVAGLGFNVGVRYDEVPVAVVEACAELSLPLVEIPLETPLIAITQAVIRRLSEQEMETLHQALTYQRNITRSAIRGGLPGIVVVVSRELGCDAVVLDEYGAVMATSTRDKRLLDFLHEQWLERAAETRRSGTVGVQTEHGTLEIQTLRGRSALVGWLAVHLRGQMSSTQRLVLNQAAGLITLQLDWPAELIAAYHALGGTLLDMLLDPGQDAGSLVTHLRHFGFKAADAVNLVLVSAPRGHVRLEHLISERLEATGRPHVVTRVRGGVAVLVLTRDAPQLVSVLDTAVRDAGMTKAVLGVSASVPQTETSAAFGPAEQAAAAAMREGLRFCWFDDLTLGSILADEAIRSRIWAAAGPTLEGLERGAGARDTELLSTLEAFLHHNGSWETAARALGVHRHTMRARIARVEELTGLNLDDAECRVLLLLALMSRPRAAVVPHTDLAAVATR